MTTTAPVERQVARVRANVLGGWRGEAPRVAPKRSRVIVGLVVIVVCGWLGAALFASAGSRDEVLVVSRPVDRFSELSADDVRTTRVAADPDVGVIPAQRLDDVVGRVAATDLTEGSLLGEDQLLEPDVDVVGEDEVVVGAVLAPKDSPSSLRPGDRVGVVVRPPAGTAEAEPLTLSGWVLDVSDVEAPGARGQQVGLVVPAEAVAFVSSAAAEDRLSVALRGSG